MRYITMQVWVGVVNGCLTQILQQYFTIALQRVLIGVYMGKTNDLLHVTDKLYHIKMYQIQKKIGGNQNSNLSIERVWFHREMKTNYHIVTVTTALRRRQILSIMWGNEWPVMLVNITVPQIKLKYVSITERVFSIVDMEAIRGLGKIQNKLFFISQSNSYCET